MLENNNTNRFFRRGHFYKRLKDRTHHSEWIFCFLLELQDQVFFMLVSVSCIAYSRADYIEIFVCVRVFVRMYVWQEPGDDLASDKIGIYVRVWTLDNKKEMLSNVLIIESIQILFFRTACWRPPLGTIESNNLETGPFSILKVGTLCFPSSADFQHNRDFVYHNLWPW